MQRTITIFNKVYWRLGRWAITVITLLFFFFRSEEVWQPESFFWILILTSLLAPELAPFWSPVRANTAIISILSDAALIALLSLSLTQALVLLYIPLILASISVTVWRAPLFLCFAAVIVNAFAAFSTGTNHQIILSTIIYSFVFVLVGIGADFLKRYLAQEKGVRAKLEKKLERRSDYFLMRAHEIRTPLSLIQASVELILDGAPGPLTVQQQVFLENIDKNSQHITLLAENMLTKSKLETGIFQPTFLFADIRDPVRAVVANMRVFATRRNQNIRVYYPQVLPLISMDPVLLKQVLTNLLGNAIQHTSNGGHIVISVAKNDLNLLVSVTDDGAGMSTEQRKQIFRRFSTGSGGTGLGLMIVKQIIELHGGTVHVDTSLGRGTTFLLTFPFITTEEKS